MSSRRATVLVLLPGRSALRLQLPGSFAFALLGLLLLPLCVGTFARIGWESFRARGVVRPSELGASLHTLERSLRSLDRAPIAMHARAQRPPASPTLPTPVFSLRTLAKPRLEGTPEVVDARSVLHAFAARRAAFGGARESAFDAGTGLLRLQALRLGESLRIQPFDPTGVPQAEAFAELSRLMRCRVTGEQIAIDPQLVRILLQVGSIYNRPIQLISGHRTALVNGTTETSQHALGRAADIRIAGVSIEELRRRLIEIGARGVGLYPEKGFVHVDVRAKVKYFWTYTEAQGEQEDIHVTGAASGEIH